MSCTVRGSRSAVASHILELNHRRPSHVYRIPHGLDGELGFPEVIAKGFQVYILPKAISISFHLHLRVFAICGVYSHGSRSRDRNRRDR